MSYVKSIIITKAFLYLAWPALAHAVEENTVSQLGMDIPAAAEATAEDLIFSPRNRLAQTATPAASAAAGIPEADART